MKACAVFNKKGGVGKSTVSVCLAEALADHGRRVLLIDLDSQRCASNWIRTTDGGRTVKEILERPSMGVAGAVQPSTIDGVSLIPASPDLDDFATGQARRPGFDLSLNRALERVRGFDDVLLDCPPAFGPLVANALLASARVLVPVEASLLALAAWSETLRYLDAARECASFRVLGVVCNRLDGRTRLSREVREALQEGAPDLLFGVAIHEAVALAELPGRQLGICAVAPNSRAASEFSALATEYLERISK